MTKQLSQLADQVMKDLHANDWQEDVVRDQCDLVSGGELDSTQLDLLHDMVIARLKALPVVADRGWKMLMNSPKAHYFIEGRSLCGKWMNLGKDGFEDSNHESPDNCKACMKKRAARAV